MTNYIPIYSSTSQKTIVGYACIQGNATRHCPPMPSLDKLDGDYYMNDLSVEDRNDN